MTKKVLITGVSAGIGAALARELTARGHVVDGLGRSPPAAGSVRDFIACDLLDVGAIDEAIQAIGGRDYDVFIHNAMWTPPHAPYIRYQAQDFMDAHMVSTVAPTLLLQKIGMGMKRRGGGQLLFLGSLIQHTGSDGQLPYLTAKAALGGLVKGLAVELGKYGVTSNLVLLGAVETEKVRQNLSAEALAGLKAKLPRGELIAVAEVARTLAHLVEGELRLINGSEILLTDSQHLWKAK